MTNLTQAPTNDIRTDQVFSFVAPEVARAVIDKCNKMINEGDPSFIMQSLQTFKYQDDILRYLIVNTHSTAKADLVRKIINEWIQFKTQELHEDSP